MLDRKRKGLGMVMVLVLVLGYLHTLYRSIVCRTDDDSVEAVESVG